MRQTIVFKLFLAFLGVALVVLVISMGLTRWNFQRSFLNYINESEGARLELLAMRLADAYEKDGGWASLRNDMDRWIMLMAPPTQMGRPSLGVGLPGRMPDGMPVIVTPDPLAISPRIAVLDEHGVRLFGPPAAENALQVERIFYAGKEVGSLRLNPLTTLADQIDVRFAEQHTRWIYGSSVGILLMAALVSVFFARHLVSPVRSLTRGTQALAEGRFGERIRVTSKDELGQLGIDFNALAETLEHHQAAQRQWIADISHELRTPLSVLQGELQAVEDGIRELGEATHKSLSAEVERLVILVDDIYELSVSELGALRYRKERSDVVGILREVLDSHEQRFTAKNISLETALPDSSLEALVDSSRLVQLITNVLENSVRYTNKDGASRVNCWRDGDDIVIDFEDSAPGVPDDTLPHLFDRLYRVEDSRGRGTGGAGIGLAICRNIAHAHGAELNAWTSVLGGLHVRLRLPLINVAST